ncbi:hypothetical protein LJ754_00085 [Arthrobacter sp. zg-Y40]|uniref:hypothetical protein n=1 Tax=Arthrobacter sp. zg-Y40 TaxID=2886939 RepID=UPI001D136F4F|nr:hypothetical protein [Arthrobacter sp. zg-Y40]MCC3277567.1 hypothetical protein [Arthrobacter sp. zg-Y40]
MARTSVYLTTLGIGSAAAVWAARKLHRLTDNDAVRLASGGAAAGTRVPRTVSAAGPATPTTVTTADPAANLPARTWVVDNSADWDGNPGELVVLPRSRSPKDGGTK